MLAIEKNLWEQGIELIAGVDEAGRGPLAGPVVAAAVIFPEGYLIDGVNDSKKLTPKKREILFEKITREALAIGVGIIDEKYIDEHNILRAALVSMKNAVDKLIEKPSYVLVDGNGLPEWEYHAEAIVKGDSLSFTIAAASIIAKVTRDKIMAEYDKQFPSYAFAKHKGYATRYHIDAIKKAGLCPIHRKTFCRKILGQQTELSFSI